MLLATSTYLSQFLLPLFSIFRLLTLFASLHSQVVVSPLGITSAGKINQCYLLATSAYLLLFLLPLFSILRLLTLFASLHYQVAVSPLGITSTGKINHWATLRPSQGDLSRLLYYGKLKDMVIRALVGIRVFTFTYLIIRKMSPSFYDGFNASFITSILFPVFITLPRPLLLLLFWFYCYFYYCLIIFHLHS